MKKVLVILVMVLSSVVANAESGWPMCIDYKNGYMSSIENVGRYAELERNNVDKMKSQLIGLDPYSEEYHNLKTQIIKQEQKASMYEEEYRYRKTKDVLTVNIVGDDNYKTIHVEVAQGTSIEDFLSTAVNSENLMSYAMKWDFDVNHVKDKYYNSKIQWDYDRTFNVDNYTLYRTEHIACKVKIVSPTEEKVVTVYMKNAHDSK